MIFGLIFEGLIGASSLLRFDKNDDMILGSAEG